MLTFYVKVFRTSLFPSPLMDLVHVWCEDRYWSKILHSAIPTPIHHFKVKVTDLRTFMSKFCVKVFRTSLFPNPMMDSVHVWCDNRYWSRISHSVIPISIHQFKVKVTDLELLCQSFVLMFLGPHCFQTLWWIWFMFWYDDRYWSKILHSTIPTPIHDLKVKVTDLELSC